MGMQSGLIEFEVEQKSLRAIERKLKNCKEQAPVALKNALNATARDAQKELAVEAQKTYTVRTGGFLKAMKLRRASVAKLEASIKVTGEPLPLKSFQVSKAEGQIRAKVLKSGSLKPLVKGGIKAFVNNIAKKGQQRKNTTSKGAKGTNVKHMAVAQRLEKTRLPTKELYSNSIPTMVGNEKRVYGIVEPRIQQNLQKNIQKQIDKILGGR